jgi:fluoride exporter
MTLLVVFLGGMIGAPVRYTLDRLVQDRTGGAFPWGTLMVNVLGSVILGALLGAGVPRGLQLLLGTGACGALTTFSTLGYETVRMLEDGSLLRAALNAVGSLVLGVLAAAGSYALAASLS